MDKNNYIIGCNLGQDTEYSPRTNPWIDVSTCTGQVATGYIPLELEGSPVPLGNTIPNDPVPSCDKRGLLFGLLPRSVIFSP